MLLDQALIVKPAVTSEEGLLFKSIVGRPDVLDISDNRRSIILDAALPGSFSGALRIDLGSD